MATLNRRSFIANTSLMLAGSSVFGLGHGIDKQALLSFSTLGCPNWTFTEIVDFAGRNHYQGIEFRGILRELDLTRCTEFNSKKNIGSTKKILADKGLKVVDLGSSAEMHHADAAERTKNLDEARKFIDLAHEVSCPFVRVFPNKIPEEKERNKTLDIIVSALMKLGEYANGSGVTVLMETHGDLLLIADLKHIMESVNDKNVALVWDVVNMWSVTKEPPRDAYTALSKYIRHVHLKDLVLDNGKEKYTLFGKGIAPVKEAVEVLYGGGYNGYYSFEWEKLWHPEIEDPSIALADFPKAIKKYFSK